MLSSKKSPPKQQDEARMRQRLYPYLLNASQHNREVLKNMIATKKLQIQPLRKSTSPFRWTNKSFALPLLREKTKQAEEEIMHKRYSINNTIIHEDSARLTFRQDRKTVYVSRQQRVRSRNMPTKPVSSLQKSKELKEVEAIPTQKIFVFRSGDEYIKDTLLSLDWFQTKTKNDFNYNLKWTTTDSPSDYSDLKQGQLFNHIRFSQTLTDKAKLTACLNKIRCDFYPRSYDLSVSYFDFVADFTKTGILSLLKRFISLIKSRRYDLYSNPLRCQLASVLKKSEFVADKQNDFVINIGLAVHLCLYVEKLRKKQRYMHFELEEDYIEVDVNIDQKTIQTLLQFSRQPLTHKKNPQDNVKFQTPSDQLISLLVLYNNLFARYVPQYESDGQNNVWIMKPSSSSKGQGIQLVNKLDISVARMQSKLIQKYVESCLIIHNWDGYRHLDNKKFDIRQWVLVTCQPRRIYRFSSSYLRFCSEQYNIDKLKQEKKHLTNYYVNRGNFETNDESSVLPTEKLLSFLKEQRNTDIYEHYHRQLDKIIIETVNSARMLDNRKGCFQLFGFDLLIDKQFKVWLLEVNLSPACEARTGWLEEMLVSMSQGLLHIVLPKSLSFKYRANPQHNWKMIYEDIQKPQNIYLRRSPQLDQIRTVDMEGGLMKEVRKKVQAKRVFSNLVERYHQHWQQATVQMLRNLKPRNPQQIQEEYEKLATIVKTVQLFFRLQLRKAFTDILDHSMSEKYYEMHYDQ